MVSTGAADGSRFDMNLVQLRKFLQTLVSSDILEFVDGSYRLRR
jgi:hypothetical protein